VFEAALRQSVQIVLAPEVEIVGLSVDGLALGEQKLLCERELEPQCLGDLLCDLLLDVKDVVEFAFVSVSPDLTVGSDVDELGCDAKRVLESAHRATDDVASTQLAADCTDIMLELFQLLGGPARDQLDFAN